MGKLAAPKGVKEETTTAAAQDATAQRQLAKRKAQERTEKRTAAKRQQAAERIAATTEQMSGAVTEAAAAANQLNSAMNEISTAATQAGAAVEQGQRKADALAQAAEESSTAAEGAVNRTKNVQALIRTTTLDINLLVDNVVGAAESNIESAKMIAELEKQSEDIGNVVAEVAGIADQTNLLALNAAIEAARAGEHGRGFAVVADEVRNLAEGAEKSARAIRDLIKEIQTDVKQVSADVEKAGNAAQEEAEKGKEIIQQFSVINTDTAVVQEGCTEINRLSTTAAAAVENFRKGAGEIAAAGQEAMSAAEESSNAVNEQLKAMQDMESAVDELAQMAEDLKINTDSDKSSEELAAAAEELSATVAEIGAAAQQIMTAIEQISKGADVQSRATNTSKGDIEEIETSSREISEKAKSLRDATTSLGKLVAENKVAVDKMITGIGDSADKAIRSADNIQVLEGRIREIDKIVDAISLVALQTNLLAVSGGIEAARSGEHGKGFAVVAGDIRTLAADSEKNAERIKDLVRAIQDQVRKVTEDILSVRNNARQQVEQAKQSTANLDIIETDFAEVLKAIIGTQTKAERALADAAEARDGVDQISSAAEQAASASQEAATAAEQQKKGMDEITQTIEEISAMADELQN